MTTAHILMGQSNLIGPAPDGLFPVLPPDRFFAAQRASRALRDVTLGVTGAGPSSPLVNILHRWWELTGEHPLGLVTSVSGSSLLQAADDGAGFWQADLPGSLLDQALLLAGRLFGGVALSPRLTCSRVAVHWCQGEVDAQSVNGTTVTGALYAAALQGVHDRLAAALAALGCPLARFCVYQTGYRVSSPDLAGWAQVRDAQAEFVAANPATALMVWNRANERLPLAVDGQGDWLGGWAYVDDVHYTAAANRAMGRGGAAALAAALA